MVQSNLANVWPPVDVASQAQFDLWQNVAGILTDPSAVLGILEQTEVASRDASDAVRILGAVALTEGLTGDEPQEPLVRQQAHGALLRLLKHTAEPARAEHAVGFGLAFMRGVRAERKRLRDVADAILLDPDFTGSDDERLTLASTVADEPYQEIPPEIEAGNFMPRTSVEKVASLRNLITESDVEGFMLNVARNVAVVENTNQDKGTRLRAAINLTETLVPMLRMFGSRYAKLEKRAWDSAWKVFQSNDPKVTLAIENARQLAEQSQQPVESFIHDLMRGTAGNIKEFRVKSPGSIDLKRLRKGLKEVSDVPDILGYRIEASNENELITIIENLLNAFESSKHNHIVTKDYIIELGRHVSPESALNPEDQAAIVLDIANAARIHQKLGAPSNVLPGEPKASGFQTVHVNLAIRWRDGFSEPLNVELQLGTTKMHKNNEAGNAVSAIYKLNPGSAGDMREAKRIVESIRLRAEAYAQGDRKLTFNTKLRLLELFPEIPNDLSDLYRVVRAGNKRIVIPAKLEGWIESGDFSEKFNNEGSTIVVLPVDYVDESAFRRIIGSENPAWISGDTGLNKALMYARRWHIDDIRRSGLNHFEGHVLPLTLAYFMYFKARGLEISENQLISMLLHDAVEDAPDIKGARLRRHKTILKDFDHEVASSVRIQTKERKKAGDTGDDMDKHQASLLGGIEESIGEAEIVKKAIDRTGNHIGDIIAATETGHFRDKYLQYFMNTMKYYQPLFDKHYDARILWLALEDIFNIVYQKIEQ